MGVPGTYPCPLGIHTERKGHKTMKKTYTSILAIVAFASMVCCQVAEAEAAPAAPMAMADASSGAPEPRGNDAVRRALEELSEPRGNDAVRRALEELSAPAAPVVVDAAVAAYQAALGQRSEAVHKAAEAKLAVAKATPAAQAELGTAIGDMATGDANVTDPVAKKICVQQTTAVMTAWTCYWAGVEQLAVPEGAALPVVMAVQGHSAQNVGRAAADVVAVEREVGRLKAGKPWYSALLFWR